MTRRLLLRVRGDGRERGNAMMEFTGLGIMLLFPLVYLLLTVFQVQAAYYGVTAATREGSRAFTLGQSVPDAHDRAREAMRWALKDQNVPLSGTDWEVTCEPAGGCLTADSVAVARVSYQVPMPLWPPIFGQKPSIRVESEHRTPFGQYRQDVG